MSLQVWLPLTKDLRQQGLSDVTVTNNGATFNSAGKLGGTYTFNGSSNYLTVSKGYFGTNYSYSLWFYTTSTSATQNLGCCRNSVGEGFAIFLIGGKIRIDGGGTGDATQWVTNYTFSANAWTHLTVTCANGVLKFYINGIYQGTKTITLTSSKWGTIYSVGASQASGSGYGNFLNGKINDVRIYDHTLSEMEIKQLSQGLVLHYPLDRQGFGQENLLKESQIEKTGASNSAQWFRWNTVPTTLTANQTYTLSFDAKMSVATDVFYISWSNGDSTQEVWNQGTQVTTEYKRYSFTGATTKTNINAILMSNYKGYNRGNNNNTTGILSVKNIKLELDDKATPWCPASTDTIYTTMGLNSTIEYDCSGFCNNGNKITNTITYNSDTSKYAVSTHFNGTYDGIIIENLALKDIINSAVTYAFWIKPENETGARSVYFGSYNTGPSWSIEKTTGNIIRSYWNGSPDETCSGATIIDGVWQHVCLTKSGTNDIKVYINGVQKWASTATHSNLNFPTTFRIGRDTRSNDGTPYKGLMSDFRIYATALSAEDVKSLYQNSAYIDSSGNIYGAVHTEV